MNRHQSKIPGEGTDGLAYYTFPSLDAFPELVHAVTTRHGGVSSGPYATLNLSCGLGDDPAAIEENIGRVSAALELRRDHLISPRQRHTANVRRAGHGDWGVPLDGFDVLITDEPGVPLLLVYADCTPVLIFDPVRRAAALVHSGWRGTVLGAGRAAVAALAAEFGSRPGDLVAAVGPSIGPCCYEIGEVVTAAVEAAFSRPDELLPVADPPHGIGGQGRRHFDLWAANRRLLAEAGVRHIEVSGLCTACRTDEFYSHRAEHGKTGHFGAVMMIAE